MFEISTLEEVIKQSGVLAARPPSAAGWHTVKCSVCSDYKERAGFRFDGGNTSYHCFNCSLLAGHSTTANKFSTKMMSVLVAFGIDLSAARKTLFAGFGATTTVTAEDTDARNRVAHPTPIALPPEFQFISSTNPAHADAIAYLTPRCVDFTKYGLMVSTTTDPKNKWYKRVIVPMYNRGNNIIFYQGRTYSGHKMRWESPTDPKSNVLFGYHNLDASDKDYVIVCEGPFDAMSVDGVAILGSSFTPFHEHVLALSRKKKIVIPQRDKNGRTMALRALELGFTLSFPDIGGSQDINDAIIQYGRLYVEQQIITKCTTSKYSAQLKLGVWCLN